MALFKFFRSKSDEKAGTSSDDTGDRDPNENNSAVKSHTETGHTTNPTVQDTSQKTSDKDADITIEIVIDGKKAGSGTKKRAEMFDANNIVPLQVDLSYDAVLHEKELKEKEFYKPIEPFIEAIDGEMWKECIPSNVYSEFDFEFAKERAKKVYREFDGDVKKAKSFVFQGMKVSDRPYVLAMSIITWVDAKVSVDEMRKRGIKTYTIECNDRDKCCKEHSEQVYSLDDNLQLPPYKEGCRCRIRNEDGSPILNIDLRSKRKRRTYDPNNRPSNEEMYGSYIKNIKEDDCSYLKRMFTDEQIDHAKKIAIDMCRSGDVIMVEYNLPDYTKDPGEQKLVQTLITHSKVLDEIRIACNIYTNFPDQTPRYTIMCMDRKCPLCNKYGDNDVFEFKDPKAVYPPFYLGCKCRICVVPASRD